MFLSSCLFVDHVLDGYAGLGPHGAGQVTGFNTDVFSEKDDTGSSSEGGVRPGDTSSTHRLSLPSSRHSSISSDMAVPHLKLDQLYNGHGPNTKYFGPAAKSQFYTFYKQISRDATRVEQGPMRVGHCCWS